MIIWTQKVLDLAASVGLPEALRRLSRRSRKPVKVKPHRRKFYGSRFVKAVKG